MLKYTDLTGRHIDRVQTAIDRIRAFCPPEGYYLAFSGGKDSVCIKALADMAVMRWWLNKASKKQIDGQTSIFEEEIDHG